MLQVSTAAMIKFQQIIRKYKIQYIESFDLLEKKKKKKEAQKANASWCTTLHPKFFELALRAHGHRVAHNCTPCDGLFLTKPANTTRTHASPHREITTGTSTGTLYMQLASASGAHLSIVCLRSLSVEFVSGVDSTNFSPRITRWNSLCDGLAGSKNESYTPPTYRQKYICTAMRAFRDKHDTPTTHAGWQQGYRQNIFLLIDALNRKTKKRKSREAVLTTNQQKNSIRSTRSCCGTLVYCSFPPLVTFW